MKIAAPLQPILNIAVIKDVKQQYQIYAERGLAFSVPNNLPKNRPWNYTCNKYKLGEIQQRLQNGNPRNSNTKTTREQHYPVIQSIAQ